MDEPTPERCRELAAKPSIDVADWIELTGMGTGDHAFYVVDHAGVRIRGWSADFIEDAPVAWQGEMCQQNAGAGLTFPSQPADVVAFVENDLGVFGLPDEFVDEVHRLHATAGDRSADEGVTVETYPSTDESRYVGKQVVISVFATILHDKSWWSRSLADPSGWLAKCRHVKGRPGRGGASRWHPLDIAFGVIDLDEGKVGEINRAFSRDPRLSEWKADWEEHYGTYYKIR